MTIISINYEWMEFPIHSSLKRINYITYHKPHSSVSIASDHRLDNQGLIPLTEAKDFFPLASLSSPTLGPTQPPVQWVLGVLSPRVKCGQGMVLTTHPILVLRLRKCASYTSFPPKCHPWHVVGPLYTYITYLSNTRILTALTSERYITARVHSVP
jgi:hypothetical protein